MACRLAEMLLCMLDANTSGCELYVKTCQDMSRRVRHVKTCQDSRAPCHTERDTQKNGIGMELMELTEADIAQPGHEPLLQQHR